MFKSIHLKNINFKYIVATLLMFSGIMAICFDLFTQGFVVFAPYGIEEYVYLKDMQGSSDDDALLMGFFGIISIIISMIISLIKNTVYVVRVGSLIFLFLFILVLLTESGPVNQLITITIQYDQNIYLILWCIFFMLYAIFLTVMNIKKN